MGEINVQVKGGQSAQVPSGATVADALKAIDRDAAKRALAARVNGREVDLTYCLDESSANGSAGEGGARLPRPPRGPGGIPHPTAPPPAAAPARLFPRPK